MAQFVAYVYPERSGFRIFIEGLGDARVESLDEAVPAALRIVGRSVFASYPDRDVAARPGTSELIALELRIVRVRSPASPTGP